MGAHDVIIIGGGPAASATAMHLLQRGIRPLIVERDQFPRYHIGESLTGECGNWLRELGFETYMRESNYPVKYGVTVWGSGGRNSFWVPVMKRGMDGKLHETSTWQVRRSEFDTHLLQTAIGRGAGYLPATVEQVVRDGDRVVGLAATMPKGESVELRAEVVVDASGQATFLANRGLTSPKLRAGYERQAAFFSQVTGAVRDDGPAGGNVIIFYRAKHHWAWFIPLDHEATSIGVVVPGEYYQAQGLSTEDFLKREIVAMNPELTWRLNDIEFIEPVRTASNYSYHIEHFTGKGFLCVGDSHRFVDPIFSFGVFLAMKEAGYAAAAILDYLEGKTSRLNNPFAAYQDQVDGGQRVIQDLIDCFWEYPLAFQRMAHLTHQYDIIDCFAGRIYHKDDEQLSDGVLTMRRLMAKRRVSK